MVWCGVVVWCGGMVGKPILEFSLAQTEQHSFYCCKMEKFLHSVNNSSRHLITLLRPTLTNKCMLAVLATISASSEINLLKFPTFWIMNDYIE